MATGITKVEGERPPAIYVAASKSYETPAQMVARTSRNRLARLAAKETALAESIARNTGTKKAQIYEAAGGREMAHRLKMDAAVKQELRSLAGLSDDTPLMYKAMDLVPLWRGKVWEYGQAMMVGYRWGEDFSEVAEEVVNPRNRRLSEESNVYLGGTVLARGWAFGREVVDVNSITTERLIAITGGVADSVFQLEQHGLIRPAQAPRPAVDFVSA